MQIETIVIAAAGIIGATLLAWAVNRFLASFPTAKEFIELNSTVSRVATSLDSVGDKLEAVGEKIEALAESQNDTKTELLLLTARVEHVEKTG
jgi:outer membrane murein-binding lipoprotein Lpp